MPDDSFPNPKIVLTILNCLDFIDINEEDEEQLGKLESSLKVYKDQCKSSAYDECNALVNKILDKWYSKKAQIKTNYLNYDGIHEKQRKFENLIKSEKKRYRDEHGYDEDEDEEP